MTENNAVKCKILQKYLQDNGDILFAVNMHDSSGKIFMYTVAAKYVPKTGACECHFEPHMTGLKRMEFEGKNRICSHYPGGNCDIVTEEITSLKSSEQF